MDRGRILIIALLGVVAFLGTALVVQWLQPTTTTTQPAVSATASPSATATASPSSTQPQLARRQAGDTMAIGELDAPVVMVRWTDLRCPYCAVFENEVLPKIISTYVETGKLRIEVNDVAFFGEQSLQAAVAARAAGEQGLYQEYLSTVFAAAPESGHPEFTEAKLIGFAKTAGVPDQAAFKAALSDADLQAAVSTSTSTAQQLGVTSVPFFLIGDTAFAGAQSWETFQRVIDSELTKAGA